MFCKGGTYIESLLKCTKFKNYTFINGNHTTMVSSSHLTKAWYKIHITDPLLKSTKFSTDKSKSVGNKPRSKQIEYGYQTVNYL